MLTCYRCDGSLVMGTSHADKEDCIRRLQDQVAALKAVVETLATDLAKYEGPDCA